ncbi:MAG: type II toxin-antitoxin system HicA family toxin [Spirochaetales bacterium]|nr:type II toxin-antitoxin system HicA family toxin [Spirochaetales bacterium]
MNKKHQKTLDAIFIRREGLIPRPALAGFYMRNLLFGKSIFVLGMKPDRLNPFLAEPTILRSSAPEWLINPPPSNINWSDIEALLIALGAEITEGNGSRVRIKLNKIRAVFHRPHPQKETDKGSVKSMKRFLQNAGVKP